MRSVIRSWRLLAACAALAVAGAAPAHSDSGQLDVYSIVAVHVNGEATDIVGVFKSNGAGCSTLSRDAAQRVELFRPDEKESCLEAVSGLEFDYDSSAQSLSLYRIASPTDAVRVSPRRQSSPGRKLALSPREKSFTADYSVLGQSVKTNGDRTTSFFANADTAISFEQGTFRNAFVMSQSGGESELVRLQSTFEIDDPHTLTQYKFGDAISRPSGWDRARPFAGVQIGRAFSLDPETQRRPFESLQSILRERSQVEVRVNGVSQGVQTLDPGAYEFAPDPVDGLNEVEIEIRDQQGVRSIEELSFVSSAAALAPGESDYSVSAGYPRTYNGLSNDYDANLFASALYRRGLETGVTVETNAYASETTQGFGAGGVAALGDIGVVNAGLGFSTNADRGGGVVVSTGFERRVRRASVSVNARAASEGYSDLATDAGAEFPRLSVRARAGVNTTAGVFSAAYTAEHRTLTGDRDFLSFGWERFGPAGRSSWFASGYQDFEMDAAGVTIGYRRIFGRSSARASVNEDDGRRSGTVSYNSISADRRTRWFASVSENGDGDRAQIGATRDTDRGAAFADYTKAGNAESATLGWRGGFVALGGDAAFTAQTGESFAVVDTGDFAGAEVYQENRLIGRTDENARLIIPRLRPYERNSISVIADDVPLDYSVREPAHVFRPQRGGTRVAFDIERDLSLSFIVLNEAGEPLGPGAPIRLERRGDASVIGYDGRAYFDHADADDQIIVEMPDGPFRASVRSVRDTGVLIVKEQEKKRYAALSGV